MCCGVAIWPAKLDLIAPFSQDAILTVVDDKMIFVPWDVFFGLASSFEGHGRNSSHPNHEEALIIRPQKQPNSGIKHTKIFCSVLSGQHLPSAIASGGSSGQLVLPIAKQLIRREIMGNADVVGVFYILSFLKKRG